MIPKPPVIPKGSSLRKRLGGREMVAWGIILSCVGLFVWESQWVTRWHAAGESLTPPFQLTIQGRYLVGNRQLLKQFGSAISPAQAAQMIDAVDRTLKLPADRLRLTPVVAELQGVAAARERLRSLEGSLRTLEFEHDAKTLEAIYEGGAASITELDRAALIAHLGWFGQLAITWQQTDESPARKVVLIAAERTAVAAIGVIVIALGALLVGVVLLAFAIAGVSAGTIRARYLPSADPPVRYLEAFALYLVGMVALSIIARLLHWRDLWPSFLLPLLPIISLAWPARQNGVRATARATGWSGNGNLIREAGAGVVGYLAGMPVLAAGVVAALGLGKLVNAQPTHPVVEYAARGPGVVVQLFVLASIIAPVVEETMFRGALYNYFRGRSRWIISAAGTGFLFAAIHPQGWTTIPAIAAIGIVLASIREWRGSLFASMTAHAMNNALVCMFLVVAAG